MTNETRGMALASRVKAARSLVDRGIGLLGTRFLAAGAGLWISPCTSVHTLFMRYPIDIAFLDGGGKVLAQRTLPPWRLSPWVPRAAGVLELVAGTLERTGTAVGDRLTLKAVP